MCIHVSFTMYVLLTVLSTLSFLLPSSISVSVSCIPPTEPKLSCCQQVAVWIFHHSRLIEWLGRLKYLQRTVFLYEAITMWNRSICRCLWCLQHTPVFTYASCIFQSAQTLLIPVDTSNTCHFGDLQRCYLISYACQTREQMRGELVTNSMSNDSFT